MAGEEKIVHNIWEKNLDEVVEFIKWASKKGEHNWSWTASKNWDCKYVELRFDMRDGAFVIRDRNGKRITFDELKYQSRL
jgi:hypothetical protein